MRRGVARMIGVRKERRDRRIELIRTDRPVSVLGVPAGDRRVVVSDTDQRVDAGRAWRICVQPVLRYFLTDQVGPGFDETYRPLPVECQPRGVERSGRRGD